MAATGSIQDPMRNLFGGNIRQGFCFSCHLHKVSLPVPLRCLPYWRNHHCRIIGFFLRRIYYREAANKYRGWRQWPGKGALFPKSGASFMVWPGCWGIFLPSARGRRLQQSELGAGWPARLPVGFWASCLSSSARSRCCSYGMSYLTRRDSICPGKAE